MGSHSSKTQTKSTRADKGQRDKHPEPKTKQPNASALQIESESSLDASEDAPIIAPAVYQLDPAPRAQLATDDFIQVGPYTLTFALAQRIARDLRNLNSSPAIAELESPREKPPSGSDLALYDFKLQLLDDYLILLVQSWIELPPALFGVLKNEHLTTLFNCAPGCCFHAARDEQLAFISCMGIEIMGRDRQRKCMCVEINYACRCRTNFACNKCPSHLIFSRHELHDGRMMLVTTNWRNLGQCLNIEDDVWRSQTSGLDLLSTASHQGQSRFEALEWAPLQEYTRLVPYESITTPKTRDVADKAVRKLSV